MALVRLNKPLLQAHERPDTILSPYPWGVIIIHPNGDIEYDDAYITPNRVEEYIEYSYKPDLWRL